MKITAPIELNFSIRRLNIARMFAFYLVRIPNQVKIIFFNYSQIERARYSASGLKTFLAWMKLLLGSSVSMSRMGVPFSLFSAVICSRNGLNVSSAAPVCNPSEPCIGFNPWTLAILAESSFFLGRPSSTSQTLFTLFTFSLRTLMMQLPT